MSKTGLLVLLVLLLGAVLLAQGPAGAQSPAQTYDLSWWTVDGGGATFVTGGDYSLGGTAGQLDAGVLSGGDYTLGGGFWRGGVAAATVYAIYLPVVFR